MREVVRVGDAVQVLHMSADTPFGEMWSWIGGYRVTAVGDRMVEVEQMSGHHAGQRLHVVLAHVRPMPGQSPPADSTGQVSRAIAVLSDAMDARRGVSKGAAMRPRRPGRPARGR